MNIIPEGYIITYTGRIINPLRPDPEQINLLDICHSLSNICRFSGQVKVFYSVADHTCRVHDLVSEENKLYALLHDASECFLADLATPVKSSKEMKSFRKAEERLMRAICDKFDISYEMPEEVYYADKTLLATEQRDLMESGAFVLNGVKPLAERIFPLTSPESECGMIYRFEKLGYEVTR